MAFGISHRNMGRSSSISNTSTTSEAMDEQTAILDRQASPFDHQASFVPFDHKPAIERLCESMGYSVKSANSTPLRILQADALTYIEKLTASKTPTRRTRDLHWLQTQSRLRRLIPKEHFGPCGGPEHAWHETEWECEQERLSDATARYITVLKFEEDAKNKKMEVMMRKEKVITVIEEQLYSIEKSDATPCAEQVLEEDEGAVDRALTAIETWCDDWLAGRIADGDWNRMDECLEILNKKI